MIAEEKEKACEWESETDGQTDMEKIKNMS